jgi:hypothetical protein
MAITVHKAPQRQPSFGERFARSVGPALEAGMGKYEQLQKESEAKEFEKKENEQFQALTGLDISGIKDPKIRQEAFKQAFETKQRNNLLSSLGFGNEDVSQSGASVSQQSPGQQQQPGQQMQDMINPETGNVDVGEVGLETSKRRIPQQKINAAAIAAPELAKAWTEQNKAIDREEARTQKAQTQERQFFHKETAKFDDALMTEAKAAEKKNRALDRQLANVDKIGWWDRIISTGVAGPLTDIFRSKTAQEFDANTLPQLEGQRQLLGGVLSDSDIRLLMQKIVTASKDPEANRYIGQFMKMENEIPILKKHIADELKSENGGYRPPNYQSEIDRVFELRYGDEIRQMQGDILKLSDDPKKLDQIGRRTVPPGTPLGEDTILMYMKLADNDPEIATQMAKRDGYDISE